MSVDLHKYNDNWMEEYIHPDLRCKDEHLILEEYKVNGVGTDIFLFPVFTPKFCKDLIEYANKMPEGSEENGQTIHGWGTGRHNHYPTYDIGIDVLGLGEIYKHILYDFLYPIAYFAYRESFSNPDDYLSENFLVKYKYNTHHINLPAHFDTSAISFNISLNDNYTGGGCWFTKQEILVKPPMGYGIVHPGGISHRHGARSILKGKRYQLVSFIKSRVFDHLVNKENGEQLFYQ